jgi:hypothetical protein
VTPIFYSKDKVLLLQVVVESRSADPARAFSR